MPSIHININKTMPLMHININKAMPLVHINMNKTMSLLHIKMNKIMNAPNDCKRHEKPNLNLKSLQCITITYGNTLPRLKRFY